MKNYKPQPRHECRDYNRKVRSCKLRTTKTVLEKKKAAHCAAKKGILPFFRSRRTSHDRM